MSHQKIFEEFDRQYDKLHILYYTFNANKTEKNRQELLLQLNKMGKLKSQLVTKIKDVYLGKKGIGGTNE